MTPAGLATPTAAGKVLDVLGAFGTEARELTLSAIARRSGLALRNAAMPFMEDLYESTHEVVQLGVREGTELVFTERLAGRSSVGVHTRVGLRFPLPASGAGLVLLAFAPHDVQEAVLGGSFQAFTSKTITDPALLRTILAEVRRSEIAVSDGQVTLDSLSVGAPVRDPSGAVVAAVSIVVHAGYCSDDGY